MMIKPILLYTMTAGLGDSLVMGDLRRKIEEQVPGCRCLILHRANPHINIWRNSRDEERFFCVYSPVQMLSLVRLLGQSRKSGATVFGLQMAPGSLQGFFLFAFLKRLKALDHIVDFNLINADIVIPPEGDYILQMHLNQLKKLFKIDIPSQACRLNIPFDIAGIKADQNVVGIHPWSRRGGRSFTWEDRQWRDVIGFLLSQGRKVVVFGKDPRFQAFQEWMTQDFRSDQAVGISYVPSQSVRHMVEQIASFDSMVSVNSATVHIGYALGKKMVILNGPSLGAWIPKGNNIISVHDPDAMFPGNDSVSGDPAFPQVRRIKVDDVIHALRKLS